MTNFRQDKFVRFQDWSSERSLSSDQQFSSRDEFHSGKIRRAISSVSERIQRSFEWGSVGIRSIGKSLRFSSLTDSLIKEPGSRKKILDPQGSFLQKWNKIFALSCVIAVSLDPLFFYIPVINSKKKCLGLDSNMEITASVLRSFTDIFYILHIIFQFRTAFIAPYSRVFGRGVLVEDPWKIAKRYLSSYFLIDILAVLPLPQMVILVVKTRRISGSKALHTKELLKFVVLLQYVPRLIRVYPLYKEVTRTSGIITETAWAGAAFNLFLYMLASHVLGAFWYLISIGRENACWQDACKNQTGCKSDFLYCDVNATQDLGFLDVSCPVMEPNKTFFDFGIFLDALQSDVVGSSDFPQKLFYCFWWGLRNLRFVNVTFSAFS
uniref:Ion transport domain-containing protein n=1 Tax=Nelumbo nucifera TaxID=4432 RepID=A0A822YZU9_NELNU|nr:TPA_asm: hypothetical protein HUJ06_006926 [Nelumbo nucifera]